MNRKIFGVLILMGFGLWMGMTLGKAQVLIQIDDSDPGAITFTGTINEPSLSNSDFTFYSGITLAGFFTAAAPTEPTTFVLSGNGLKPTTPLDDPSINTEHYNAIFIGYLTSPAPRDLNFFSGYDDVQDFNTSQQAFTGTATWDLSDPSYAAFSALLPPDGTTGILYAGAPFDPLVAIGTWEVVTVPEPSSLALMLGGVLVLGLALRRRARTTA